MPKKGYRTITLRNELYEELLNKYKENKEDLIKQGITSFSGYITKFLYEAIEKES